MNRRANILARLRRWKTGAGRYVVASFVAAYLSAGAAPCAAAAATQATADAAGAAHELGANAHEHHTVHDDGADDAPRGHCPHCLTDAGALPMQAADHSSCLALEELTNVAAPQAKDAPPSLAPPLGPAAFTLPPPLASPAAPPSLRAAAIPHVALNVRHCVFLI